LLLQKNHSKFNLMKAAAPRKLKGEDWLRECFDYEAKHPIAFASPRALLEARLIAEMEKARRPRRRARRNGVAHRRKAVAA
jgi:hypothetical protein